MNSASQIYEFMGCIYAGLILGVVYAVFDIVRRLLGEGRLVNAVCDFVYICICVVCSFHTLYILAYGRVALYHIIGVICGIFLYVGNVHALVKATGHRS